MAYVNAGRARIGFVILVGTSLTAGICSDAVAEAHKGRLHHAHRSVYQSRAQLVMQPQPARLETMHYYGGPKSPMWRGPAN